MSLQRPHRAPLALQGHEYRGEHAGMVKPDLTS